ncbi:hypothetical protein [Candidatus Nitrosarchaeum limnium]|jgi:transcription elongation factor Elf1|uniref:Uncharacterized protein n=1 Tax=Candidatus Nitrosarchaeum limnium BG20 TaxID=859192 RepID=S2EPP8_9ARCH|nr:hypothetical protein [Candidatus Nitrosarchaeum limnium]EPA06417.1 hypothetical protein BG20_I2136 [Candidatus Nitrosarchaeum limnium BG20]
MQKQSCKTCSSKLEVESRCKVCDQPTKLFCHACGITHENIIHPACLVIDLNNMVLESYMHQK